MESGSKAGNKSFDLGKVKGIFQVKMITDNLWCNSGRHEKARYFRGKHLCNIVSVYNLGFLALLVIW